MKIWNFFSLLQVLVAFGGSFAWDSKDAEVIRKLFIENANYNLPAEADYVDEIIHGHHIRDVEKYERQKECACIAHLIDPHCGSDDKAYDNGCFFLCAQQRNPGLRLKRWGNCPDGSGYEEI